MPVVRVVLVGFMGAGKSTTGRIVARALDWEFVDLDDEIERLHGRSPASILREQGEAAFRRIESDVAGDVLARRRIVLATGGGWGAQPGSLADLDASTCSVWLRVEPATAVARVAPAARDGAFPSQVAASPSQVAANSAARLPPASRPPPAASRPLLDDAPDPRAAAEALLRSRTAFYERAHAAVDTDDKTPDQVARSVLVRLRNLGVPY